MLVFRKLTRDTKWAWVDSNPLAFFGLLVLNFPAIFPNLKYESLNFEGLLSLSLVAPSRFLLV